MRWTPNPGVLGLKPLDGSKVYSAFRPFEVNQMSNKNYWDLVAIGTVEPHP